MVSGDAAALVVVVVVPMLSGGIFSHNQSNISQTTPPTIMTATAALRWGCARSILSYKSRRCVGTPTVRENATGMR